MEYTKTGYVLVKTNNGLAKEVFEHFKEADFVIAAWVVTGDYDVIAWLNATSDDDLYRQASTIREWRGVESSTSHLVHEGYLANMETLDNQNGAWVRLRVDKLAAAPGVLREHPFVGGWARIPGDYDYLVWIVGKTVRETMEHVLTIGEHRNWKTLTHIPLFTYRNKKMKQPI